MRLAESFAFSMSLVSEGGQFVVDESVASFAAADEACAEAAVQAERLDAPELYLVALAAFKLQLAVAGQRLEAAPGPLWDEDWVDRFYGAVSNYAAELENTPW